MANYTFDDKEHLHLLDGKPLTGTSSVGDVLAKNLTWWAAELAAIECLEAGEKIETIREEYEQAIKSGDKKKAIDALQVKYPIFKKARFAHHDKKNKTAEEGTDLHAELEHFVKAEMGHRKHKDYPDKIKPFIEWSRANVRQYHASEAHCYDDELWVGGITDAVPELNDGRLAVMDFKSAKEAYITHFIQTAGYAIQIDKNGLFSEDGQHSKKLEKPIDALIVVPFGGKALPEIKNNIQDFKDGFRHAVGLYRLMGLGK